MAGISRTHDDDWQAAPATAEPLAEAAPRNAVLDWLTNPYLTLVSRAVLGLVFFLAGLTKLGVPAAFTASINSYEMPLPGFLVQAMVWALPPIEIALGIMLLLGLFTRFAAAVAGGLMVVFLIALTQGLARGLTPDCGCFAGASASQVGTAVVHMLGPVGTFLTTEQSGWAAVIRDLVFLLMAVHLFFVPTVFSLDGLRRRVNGGADDTLDADGEVAAE